MGQQRCAGRSQTHVQLDHGLQQNELEERAKLFTHYQVRTDDLPLPGDAVLRKVLGIGSSDMLYH